MYHRILDPADCSFILEPGMFVTPSSFEQQISYLKNTHSIISIEEYITSPHQREKNFVLTFDDGWSDFYTHALPILKKYDVPACVFLPTSFIGTDKIMWTEELAILKTAFDKRSSIEKTHLRQEIQRKTKDRLSLDKSLSEIITDLKTVSDDIRKKDLDGVTAILEKYLVTPGPQYLNWEQVEEIERTSKVTFASHSHSHLISTHIDHDVLLQDISLSIEQLRLHNIENNKIFCYPNQSRSKSTDKVLEELGFIASLGKYNPGENHDSCRPICFERIGIHEDISYRTDLFALRLLGY